MLSAVINSMFDPSWHLTGGSNSGRGAVFVYDINNLFAVIGSSLRPLKYRAMQRTERLASAKCGGDHARRIAGLTVGDAFETYAKSIGGSAAGSGLAQLRIPRRQASDGYVMAPANTWRPVQR